MKRLIAGGFFLSLFCLTASAGMISGTLYYTLYTGGQNVWSVGYQYDGTNFTLSTPTNIASTDGADGIIFAPNGDLLIGGQNSGQVHQITTAGVPVTDGATGGGGSFHLALDPSGTKVYTSNFGGALATLPISGGQIQNGTAHALTGDDYGVTGEAFTPSSGAFYVNGQPNGGGNVGLLNLSTFTTTQLFSGITSAHGMVYDPFTSLLTLFGRGAVGTFDPTNTGAGVKERFGITGDFDQGAVDGQGHALIAGDSSITFIDYSASGDITSALNPTFVVGGFNGIDDVAPLTGLGSNSTPEPASLLLALSGLLAVVGVRARRKSPARRA